MIDVKQAVRKAAVFLADLFEAERVRDIRLEEVELKENSQKQRTWRVTLSFVRCCNADGPAATRTPWSPSLRPFFEDPMRDLKVVELDSEGNPTGLKQWLPQSEGRF